MTDNNTTAALFLFTKTVFCLVLSAAAVYGAFVPCSPDAMCADDNEFMISLPTGKTEANNKSSASSQKQKKEKARGTVASEDMLRGVFYDLKQTRNRQPNKEFSAVSVDGEYVSENLDPTLKVVQSFVKGTWQKSTDFNGRENYSALNAYYSPTNTAWASSFYIGNTSSATAPQAFGCPDDVKPNCWICIYSGYVVAPFSGRFRFVGFGDDFLVVRMNRDIVFDYGRISATLGIPLSSEQRSVLTSANDEKSQPSRNPIERVMPTINKRESVISFYSKNKLVIRSPEYMNTNSDFGCGLANGSVFSVRQGEVLPIEILVGDIGGNFNYVLFVERLDTNGKALYPDKPLLLFRTSDELPPSFSTDSAVAYDKNSPVWKVVDSRGKPIPSHIPPARKKDDSSGTSAEAKNSSGIREKQPPSQQKSNPKPTRTVTTAEQGSVITETIIENNGDTTIRTVTTTEVNDDTTVRRTVITETRNGKVVKKTTSTTTTENQPPEADAEPDVDANEDTDRDASASAASGDASTAKENSGNKSDDSSSRIIHTPFGSVQRNVENQE